MNEQDKNRLRYLAQPHSSKVGWQQEMDALVTDLLADVESDDMGGGPLIEMTTERNELRDRVEALENERMTVLAPRPDHVGAKIVVLETRVAELKARKDRQRSDAEIVADCNALAVTLAELDGWVPGDPHRLRMHGSGNPRVAAYWQRAVVAYELLRNDCVESALSSVIDDKSGKGGSDETS